jgi:hypothetical protein
MHHNGAGKDDPRQLWQPVVGSCVGAKYFAPTREPFADYPPGAISEAG